MFLPVAKADVARLQQILQTACKLGSGTTFTPQQYSAKVPQEFPAVIGFTSDHDRRMLFPADDLFCGRRAAVEVGKASGTADHE